MYILLWQLPDDVDIIQHQCLRDLDMLGDGRFGIVYRAEHKDWGTVAYKELKANNIEPESKSVHNQWQSQGGQDPHYALHIF